MGHGQSQSPTGELRAGPRLDARELEAVAELERACTTHEGIRLKLEWPTLRTRAGATPRDMLWWDDGRALGYAGLIRYRSSEVELTGMVHPDHRRRGIGRALCAAATAQAAREGLGRVLLVVDRASRSGLGFAGALGATPVHSEHLMVYQFPPPDGAPDDLTVGLRTQAPGDEPFVRQCLSAAFGGGDADYAWVSDPVAGRRRLVVTQRGEPVGTLSVSRDDTTTWISGFAVTPDRQGQGIGRTVLARLSRELAATAPRVSLEVQVTNDRALGLYIRTGYRAVSTMDYLDVTGIDVTGGDVTGPRGSPGGR